MKWKTSKSRFAKILRGSHGAMSPAEQQLAIAEACGGKHRNYLGDLNAMHEAEKTLSIDQRGKYAHLLLVTSEWSIAATAAQRAEAFLRVIGKWRDDQGEACPECGASVYFLATGKSYCACGWPDESRQSP